VPHNARSAFSLTSAQVRSWSDGASNVALVRLGARRWLSGGYKWPGNPPNGSQSGGILPAEPAAHQC
jgi:hypothetical protein